jgi:hypothetical protein
MPKQKISEFSATPANNTDIDSINISEGCAPSGINDAIRELMAQLKDFQVGSAGDPVTVGGVLTVQAGSASTPALTTAGDTNTGMFFPAADTIAFAEGGAEVARFDSSGNLGLGVTPSAWGGGKNIQIAASSSVVGSNDEFYLAANSYFNGTNNKYIANGFATQYGQETGVHKWFIAPTGTAGNNITFTQAMTLDASGNWILGGTSANGRARIVGAASTDSILNLETSTNNYASGLQLNALNANGASYNYISSKYGSTENWYIGGNGVDQTLVLKTAGSERARIDSSGRLLVGTTTAGYGLFGSGQRMTVNPTNDGILVAPLGQNLSAYTVQAANDSGTRYFAYIANGSSGLVGNISFTSSAVSYNTTSDYRLKNTIVPMTGALAKVAQLKPVTYKWNIDGSASEGFIAHELAEVCPHAVTGEKDAVDENGKIKPQGIDTSFLVATLTAALQEAHGLIKSLETRISALEAK